MKFSIVIPVYNRPEEVDELLESLTSQTVKDFEVLIVEDGSTRRCDEVVKKYTDRLDVHYFFKENSGQGFSRNYGFERAKGEWLVVFDSDCLIPSEYFQKVLDYLDTHPLDAYGGPDAAHPNFSPVQKAISYSMTSPFTTGGIRGGKQHVGVFHPRSFNMGIKREVFEKTGGYILPKKGEDIEFSLRIIENGFSTGLIPEAFVYHKRRTSFHQFYKQLHFFGTARINIGRYYPGEVKLIHWFPVAFLLGLPLSLLLWFVWPWLGAMGGAAYVVFAALLFVHAWYTSNERWVALLSVRAGFTQLIAYGMGMLKERFFTKAPAVRS